MSNSPSSNTAYNARNSLEKDKNLQEGIPHGNFSDFISAKTRGLGIVNNEGITSMLTALQKLPPFVRGEIEGVAFNRLSSSNSSLVAALTVFSQSITPANDEQFARSTLGS